MMTTIFMRAQPIFLYYTGNGRITLMVNFKNSKTRLKTAAILWLNLVKSRLNTRHRARSNKKFSRGSYNDANRKKAIPIAF